jgi:hypothetical protein
MPILVIEAKGEIISSNFQAFAESVRLRLAEFNLNLRTDEDFDQATADVKVLKGAEDSLKAAKEKALADAVELNDLFSKLDDLTGELSMARLDLSKQIETRKAALKTEMVETALTQLICDPSMRLGFRQQICDCFKGLKSFDKMRESVRVTVNVINDRVTRCKAALDEFEAAYGKTMTQDRRNLEASDPVVLSVELQRRFDAMTAEEERKEAKRKADEEAAKLREEAEKAKAEAKRIAAAELARQASVPARREAVDVVATAETQPPSATTTPEESPEPSDECTAQEEWCGFSDEVKSAFSRLAYYRGNLAHPENIAAAQRFAVAVNAGWNGGRP